jgi:hypothetical protein
MLVEPNEYFKQNYILKYFKNIFYFIFLYKSNK